MLGVDITVKIICDNADYACVWCVKCSVVKNYLLADSMVRLKVKNLCFRLQPTKKLGTGGGGKFFLLIVYIMTCHANITQQLTKIQIDTLNCTQENLSKDAATYQARCKQYFSVKVRKHTKKYTDIFEDLITILRMQVLFLGTNGNWKCRLFFFRPYEVIQRTPIKQSADIFLSLYHHRCYF